jgi:hypothetical protein
MSGGTLGGGVREVGASVARAVVAEWLQGARRCIADGAGKVGPSGKAKDAHAA